MARHSNLLYAPRVSFSFGKLPHRIFLLLILIVSLLNPFHSMPVFAADAPLPTAPADYSTITATGYMGSIAAPPLAVPTFTWNAVPGTTVYRLQISQDIAFTNKFEFTTPLTQFTPTNSGQFNDGEWYWRVRVDAPTASGYSSTMTFTRTWKSEDNYPVLLAPADSTDVQFYDTPIFSWQPVVGAASYRIQISTAADFTTIIYNQTTLATRHQPTVKLSNATGYYWRVIPLDPHNREGTYSQLWSFNQGYNFIPQLIEPTNFSTPTFTPTFRWTAVRGAELYRLQYSTDPSFNTGSNTIDTRNTTFTPTSTLENDVNYYWRVRAHSRNSISEWSPAWTFVKKWYIKPVLLTPVNTYQYVRFPFFSWTPVPGAAYYRIEVDSDMSFVEPFICTGNIISANTFYTCERWDGAPATVYWRVIPFDQSGKIGKPSEPSSFVKSGLFTTPNQVYPLYYYPTNHFPFPDEGVLMNPYEDRTAALPIFAWHRLTDVLTGEIVAKAYRLQVSTISNFTNIVWEVDTENQYAVPGPGQFNPSPNTDYYWRVHALDDTGSLVGSGWSQTWRARFDLSKMLPPTSGGVPTLLRPARGSEIVETTPVFEWQPYQGATSYQIQINQDRTNFTNPMVTATTAYPAYAHLDSIAQRSLNKLNYGTYYWRVRAQTSGGGWTSWSAPWRFQIASQSEWMYTRVFGSAASQLQIASDPVGDAAGIYDLSKLYASQDKDFWYFGFNAAAAGADANFALYLDRDHIDGSGATGAPAGYTISTIPAHAPEFALVIRKKSGNFSAGDVSIHAWNGTSWNVADYLDAVGGDLIYDSAASYVELKVPNTAIGMNLSFGSYATALFSLPTGPGAPQDSVPSDPLVPGTGQISRFTSVSEKMNLIFPFNNIEGDPTTYPTVLPFFWDYPTGFSGSTPWAGARMEAHLDQAFTSQKAEFRVISTTPYYAPTAHAWLNDMVGDNSYYWRVRPRFLSPELFGSWSEGWRFERQGFVPVNLQESVTFATPTFSWDMVEGAKEYDLQLDMDHNFGSPDISATTTQESYTPTSTLPNGFYYWRVRVKRYGNVINEWSPSKTFTLALPTPDGLSPHDPSALAVIPRTPTLCWRALIKSKDNTPVLAAWKYRVQISLGDPTFSQKYEEIDTEQRCYTPLKGYHDGKYYWRVAMIDGQGRLGDFSQRAEFTKQYPVTTLVSPLSGNVAQTPTFRWTPVHGAAAYRLEISQVSTYAPLYDSVTTNQTSYTPTKKYEIGKTYYWRVAIIDRENKWGPFTDATIYLNNFRVYIPLTIR